MSKGYSRLFINLGRNDRFFPGEVMQFINRNVEGRQDIGHIDIMPSFCLIEVPDKDVQKVCKALNGTHYHNKKVACRPDSETKARPMPKERGGHPQDNEARREHDSSTRRGRDNANRKKAAAERKALFEMMNTQEEGWARRKPKKKK